MGLELLARGISAAPEHAGAFRSGFRSRNKQVKEALGRGFLSRPERRDGDHLSDPWERLHFSAIAATVATGDPDGDGRNNLEEFGFGTDPKTPNLTNFLTLSPDNTELSFTLPAAAGAGYEGRLRRYALESSIDLKNWSVGPTGIADGGTVTGPVSPGGASPRFYRLSVTLD